MHENDNEVPNREVQDAAAAVENSAQANANEANAADDSQAVSVSEEQADVQTETPAIHEHVEERQAEEFAEEMEAEPHNIDGEAGEATPAEEAAAEAAVHTDEPSAEGAGETAASQKAPAKEMEAEPHNIDGEAGEATPAEEAAAEAAVHTDEPSAEASGKTAASEEAPAKPQDSMSADEILAPDAGKEQPKWPAEDAELTAMLEAVIYITDEPLTLEQICTALEQPRDRIKRLLNDLVAEWQKPQHGLSIREVAGGFKMTTKPEHHEAVRQFVKSLKAPMKLSLPALETLAVIAYKQPVTSPEIMEIRGVQGAGVLKTLIDRKLIAPAGRKNVIGKPILYKTTREFLVQFGLKDLSELPSVKEFEELARFATEPEPTPVASNPPPPAARPEANPVAPAEAEAPQNATTVAEAAEVESESSQAKQEPETEPATEPVTE